MNQLLNRVSAKKKTEKLFCAFLTMGYPNLKATKQLIREFEKAGVDILELGIPFSDPLADGPTIQFSSEQALKKGVHFTDSFRLVEELRSEGVRLPIIFFSYFNPIYHFGISRFAARAKASGFDGVIIPDLPPGDEKAFEQELTAHQLCQIFLVAPTTARQRAVEITRKSEGFIYYVSLRGVTGARSALPADVSRHLKELKRMTSKPILVGFGVSTPEQAAKLSKCGDGVIVGSAIIEQIRRAGGKTAPVVRYVETMVAAVKGRRRAGSVGR